MGRWGVETIEWLRGAADAIRMSRSPSKHSVVGVLKPSSGSAEPLTQLRNTTLRLQLRATGGRWPFSTPGTLAFRSHCKRQMPLASSRLGECGDAPTSAAVLAGRRTSRTSCAMLPPLLGWDLGPKAHLATEGSSLEAAGGEVADIW